MRLFKHGDSLAIVLPAQLAAKLTVRANDEFEFFEIGEGSVLLVKREVLNKQMKGKALADVASLLGVSPTGNSLPAAPLPPLLVFASELQAKEAAKKFENHLKKGELIGVTGSDKKVYILSSEFYNTTAAKLAPLLEKEKTLVDLVALSGFVQRDVFAVLQAMKDSGDVIEKKKGVYVAVK